MPAFFADSASALPTAFACSVFEPEPSTPFQVAEASVRPDSSSISWALIPRFERKTARRGLLGRSGDLPAHAPVTAHARLALRENRHARFPTFLRTCSSR